MAGITTPFTTPVFPFLQTVSQRTLDNITPAFVLSQRPERRADSADARRRPRAGRVLRGPRPRLGLRAAVERVACSASSPPNISVEVAYVGSKITHVGHSRHQPESADRRAARAGRRAAAARAESVLRHHPALVVARRSDDHASRSCSSRIRNTRPSACTATTSARRSTTACTRSWSSASRAACRIS